MTTTIAKIRKSDRKLVRVRPGGREEVLRKRPIRPMTEEQIETAARGDPDNPPLTEAKLKQLKPVPRVRTLRRVLGLTQEEFAARFHIPLGTLRDWEQGRTEPDQPARAYLKVIARDPEAVRRALQARPAATQR
jgi:putative transcriptional regulator